MNGDLKSALSLPAAHPDAKTVAVPARPTGRKLAFYWVAMLTLIAGVAFLSLEIGLRLLVDRALKAEKGSPLILTSVPGLGYQLAPNARGDVQTDANGLRLRGPDLTPPRRNILLIGDSIAYGMGVSYEQSFVPLLEKQVTAGSGENSAVWNAAVPGYNTTQEAIQLDQMAPLTHPNLIIVQFCMNDYLDAPVLNHQGWLETLPGQPPGAAPSSFSIVGLLYSSRALAFLKEQLRDLQQTHPEWFPVGLHYIHYVHKKPGWERAKAALLQISESARQMHAGLLVVIFPVEQQVRIGDRAAQDDLVRFAVAHSIPVLDLYDSVRAHWREGLYINYWKRAGVVDKLHLNPRGHALVAAEIAHAILSRPDFYFPALPASPMRDASAQAAAEKLAAR